MGDVTLNMGDWSVERQISSLLERLEALRGGGGAGGGGARGGGGVRAELRSVQLWRAAAAEGLASFLYVFVVCGAAGGAGVGASTSSVLLATALASGAAVTTLTLCFAHISGGHVNPAVSVAQCVRRAVSPLRAALYVAAQCGGAIAGAAMLYGVMAGAGGGYQGSLTAAMSQWGAAAAWERLGAELVLTGLVVGAHLATAPAASAATSIPSAPAALALGAAYTACSLVSMPYLNPARSLGPAFVLGRWELQWVYWLGPLGGALAAGLLHGLAARRRAASAASSASSDACRAPSAAASDDDAYDDLGKPPPTAPAHYRPYAAPTYPRAPPAAAAAPAAPAAEPLYGGTKSLYCRSPPLTRANLHRSQSVYGKSAAATAAAAAAPGPLVPAHSLYPMRTAHGLVHSQNVHNASQAAAAAAAATHGCRPPAYRHHRPDDGEPPPSAPRRPDSVYGTRRGLSVQSDDSTYGSYAGPPGGCGGGGAATVPRAPPPAAAAATSLYRHAHY